MGSIFRTNIKELSLDDIRQMKSSYKILACDMDGIEAKDYKLDSKPIILAIGNEANGLSDEIRDMTDDFIKISMQGEIESLNAAIAASIMMNILG